MLADADADAVYEGAVLPGLADTKYGAVHRCHGWHRYRFELVEHFGRVWSTSIQTGSVRPSTEVPKLASHQNRSYALFNRQLLRFTVVINKAFTQKIVRRVIQSHDAYRTVYY